MTADTPLIIERTLDAPRELVWRVHSEADHLARWWGPVGKQLLVKKLDFRVGGIFHYGMQAPDGNLWWGRFLYREIIAPQKLVYLSSFADEYANVVRAPFSASFPLLVENTLTFTEREGKTLLTLQGLPHEAGPAERAFFAGLFDSMHGGFNATYDQLQHYLAGLGAGRQPPSP